jgi:hypothetical protein
MNQALINFLLRFIATIQYIIIYYNSLSSVFIHEKHLALYKKMKIFHSLYYTTDLLFGSIAISLVMMIAEAGFHLRQTQLAQTLY